MITCTLKDKKYAVDFVSGRALREMEPAAKMYARIVALSNAAVKGEEIPQSEQVSIPDAMDVMIRWFCLLFGNQFTPDDVLDGYPVDRLMHDIALALMAVQTQTTEILIAAITAAIAAVWESPNGFVVRHVKRVSNAPAWKRAGRDEQTYSRY